MGTLSSLFTSFQFYLKRAKNWSVQVQGQVYKDKEYACNQYGFMTSVFVSQWSPVRRIICKVSLEKNKDGLTVLTEDSQMDLKNWSEKSVP